MNERDSEALAGMFNAAGYSIADDENDADVLIFNTCSVREQAERKALGKIGIMKKLKAVKPNLLIGVLGCMAQRCGEGLLKDIPHLDFVLGTGQLHRVVETVDRLIRGRFRFSCTEPSDAVLDGMSAHWRRTGDIFGQIAVTRGCNRFCSYCIVPYVRGREISRSQADIVSEAEALVADGVRELLLLGQNVAAYGWGGNTVPPPDDVSPFADLLAALDKIPGLLRLRFTSPYPTYFNRRLIDTIAASRTVCPSLHLPVQSGSDRILKAMNRQYTAADYLRVVENIRRAIPEVTFSTDVIVGFPGETEADFNATRDLLNRVGFDNSFIFKYSPRPGAKSAREVDSVPAEVKRERNRILLEDLKRRVAASLAGQVGTVQQVLVEGVSPRNVSRWCGRTGANRVIHFEPDAGIRPGVLRNVRITRAGAVSLSGTLLD